MGSTRRRHWPLLLLGAAPVAAAVGTIAPDRHTVIFFASVMAIVPLAAYMGRATEALARRLGGGIGGLLNATFGNAAELIIGALALRRGYVDLVKASLTGSIIGNVLLVFGLCALVGGLRYRKQTFNRTAASLGSTMLVLSAIGLTVPGAFHLLAQARGGGRELTLDTEIASVLLITYVASLVFTLGTHRHLYSTGISEESDGTSVWRWVGILLAATLGIGWMSELLIGSLSETARVLGLSNLFVGVVVIAVVGNAAEHYSALLLAWRNQMDAAIGITLGSSTQIALFVAPVLVFLSYVVGPMPMDLVFTVFEVVAIALAVAIITLIAHDGETHWMEGIQLLAVYVILALGFYFLPPQASP
jgi:Ca2+:H+ antiporter